MKVGCIMQFECSARVRHLIGRQQKLGSRTSNFASSIDIYVLCLEALKAL
ncbi:hypothetical protein Hdeb2414_s0046g00746811 [Helianthus debilis subsp. tardiflorus]